MSKRRFGIMIFVLPPLLVLAAWMFLVSGGPKTDYRLLYRESMEQKPMPGKNGIEAFAEAGELLTAWGEELWSDEDIDFEATDRRTDFSMLPRVGDDNPRVGLLRDSSADLTHRGIDPALARLACAGHFAFEFETGIRRPSEGASDLFSETIEWSYMGRARALMDLQIARLRFAAIDADSEQFATEWERGCAVVKASLMNEFMIDALICYSIAALLHNELAYHLYERRQALLDDPEILLRTLDRFPLALDIQRVMQHESYYASDWLQWNFTGRPGGGGYERIRILDDRVPFPKIWGISRKEVERRIDDILAWIPEAQHQSPSERGVSQFPDLFSGEYGDAWTRETWNDSLDSWQCMRSVVGATRIMLALEIYKKHQGTYPDALSALAPEILQEIPRDPLSPDGAYRYARVDPSTDEHDREYLLYSVGLDGADNAGVVFGDRAEQSHIRFGLPGSDFIFNRPRIIDPAHP